MQGDCNDMCSSPLSLSLSLTLSLSLSLSLCLSLSLSVSGSFAYTLSYTHRYTSYSIYIYIYTDIYIVSSLSPISLILHMQGLFYVYLSPFLLTVSQDKSDELCLSETLKLYCTH